MFLNGYDLLNEEEREQYNAERAAARSYKKCLHDCGATVVFKTTIAGHKLYYKQCKTCGEIRSTPKAALGNNRAASAKEYNKEEASEKQQAMFKRMDEAEDEIVLKYMGIVEQKRQARAIKYNQYLGSPEWEGKRYMVLKRCGGICEGCGINKAQHVHHLTYDRLYNEMLFDLVGVCAKCHKIIHSQEQQGL